jgi:hypothetical protein
MTARTKFRVVRWTILAASIPALWACTSRRLVEPTPAPASVFNDTFQQAVNRDLDIVFMVDNSNSMLPLQTKLAANFPTFMQVLKDLPGGLPNVHIGVVSSSMGAGPNTELQINGCKRGGDQGIFQSTPRGGPTCANAALNAGQTYIQNVNGVANYTGDIADVFSCIAKLGQDGCGLEHQFASVLRALGADGNPIPTQNEGFLRPNAYLAVVMITNEDDCSAPPDTDLFDTSSTKISDPLGPLDSYRCNEFGHLCNGLPPPRTMDADLTGTCVSNENGKLLSVADTVAKLKGLKADPSKVLVAAIAGPPEPYIVKMVPSQSRENPELWPNILHSCTAANDVMSYGDPSIRIAQWVQAFGRNGLFETICNDDFKASLQQIAETIGKVIGSPCVNGAVLNKDGTRYDAANADQRADCAVVDHTFNDQGNTINTVLANCRDNGNQAPCWELAAGSAMGCNGNFIMKFTRPADQPPSTELNSSVQCSTLICHPGVTTPNCP